MFKFLERVCEKFSNGFGKKENEIYKILTEKGLFFKYIKDQGFIVPSLKKPKKVVLVNMEHPKSFNYSFNAGMKFNIVKSKDETFLKGGLLNTLNISILLEEIEMKDDVIYVFLENQGKALKSFLDSIHSSLKEELIFICLGMEVFKTVDVVFKFNNGSFDLIKFLVKEFKKYNVSFKDDFSEMLSLIEKEGLIGVTMNMPVLKTTDTFNSTVSLFTVDRYKMLFKRVLECDIPFVKRDLFNVSLRSVLKASSVSDIKVKKDKIDVLDFSSNIEASIRELGISFNDVNFLVHYLSVKFESEKEIILSYLETKESGKKLGMLFDYLEEMDVVRKSKSGYVFV